MVAEQVSPASMTPITPPRAGTAGRVIVKPPVEVQEYIVLATARVTLAVVATGARPPELATHEVVVPLVWRNLPVCAVWVGSRALRAALAVTCPVPPPAIGRPVALVKTSAEGVPRFGVVRTGLVSVLLVRVTVAAFLVMSLVLSTAERPTSVLVIPVGVLITGLVKVLLVSVWAPVRVTVEVTSGTTRPLYSSWSEALTLRTMSALLAAFLKPMPSLLASRKTPDCAMLVEGDLMYLATIPKLAPRFRSAVRAALPPALVRAPAAIATK